MATLHAVRPHAAYPAPPAHLSHVAPLPLPSKSPFAIEPPKTQACLDCDGYINIECWFAQARPCTHCNNPGTGCQDIQHGTRFTYIALQSRHVFFYFCESERP
jgi:hypothetical protein